MSLVLIVEDESMLRASLARGIGKMEGIGVLEAASVDEAVSLLDQNPDLIVSDIDMPGRTGIELLGELGRRGLSIPIIYASAYLAAYGSQIPPNANIEVLEKPVALDDIRTLVRRKLDEADDANTPFAVPDFLQLASLGRRSVVIEVTWADGSSGEISVHDGDVWDARAGGLVGKAAFARVAWEGGGRVRCRALTQPPATRTLSGSAESLLMDSARMLDEEKRGCEETRPSYVEQALRFSSIPPAPAAFAEFDLGLGNEPLPNFEPPPIAAPSEPAPIEPAPTTEAGGNVTAGAFSRLVDEGVDALLIRDFPAALAAFTAAEALQPGDGIVCANLGRLREMGYEPPEPGETT